MIRPVKISDIEMICDIYNHYILSSVITFDETVWNTNQMLEKFEQREATHPWIVLERDQQIVGYAYIGKWGNKQGFLYTAESTVYLHPDYCSKGDGTKLYTELIHIVKRSTEINSLIAGITIPNPISIALHKKLGFEQKAFLPQLGYKFKKWIDVEYWQLLLK